MADTKLFDLTAFTSGADADVIVAVDVSDAAQGVNGSTRKMTFANLKAYIAASLSLTGTPAAPTAAGGTNTTQVATTAFVRTEIAALVASSPAALDTLDELAAALGDDANFAATITTALAGKAPTASPTFSGPITHPGINIVAPGAMAALSWDPTVGYVTKTISADSTLTFATTPATNSIFAIHVTNSDSSARTLTLPVVGTYYSMARQANQGTVAIPAGGTVEIWLRALGSNSYRMQGDPVPLANKGIPYGVDTVANGDLVLVTYAPFAGTVTLSSTDCESGTCTLVVKVAGVTATGTANSVSTTKTSQSVSVAVAVGDEIAIGISANSSCLGLRGTIVIAPAGP